MRYFKAISTNEMDKKLLSYYETFCKSICYKTLCLVFCFLYSFTLTLNGSKSYNIERNLFKQRHKGVIKKYFQVILRLVLSHRECMSKRNCKISKFMSFRACLYPSPDIKGYYVAHCLELDLIGEGKTPLDAIVELIQAIELQIEACDDISQFLFPAPAPIWKKYKDSIRVGRVVLKRIIDDAIQNLSQLDNVPYLENVAATSTIPQEYTTIGCI